MNKNKKKKNKKEVLGRIEKTFFLEYPIQRLFEN